MRIPFTKIEIKKHNPDRTEIDNYLYKALVDPNTKFQNIRPKMDDRDTLGDDDGLMPVQPLPYRSLKEVALYSDVLRTIHQNLRKEIFRHDYSVVEKFSKKCNNEDCEKEFQNPTDKCDECKGTDLRDPDVSQKKKLEQFLKEVNDNSQSLINVSEQLEDDLNIYDNAYLLCVKDYYWETDGRLYGFYPVELLRMDPMFVRIIADKRGRPGISNNGDRLSICSDHRSVLIRNEETCPSCKKETFPAYYRAKEPEGKNIYYAKGEVKHLSKYNPSLTYGFSVIFSIWMKVVTLMNMDNYMKNYYAKQRPPRGLLFVNTPNMDSFEKAWNWMTDEFKRNPHQIPPIAIENPTGSKGKLVEFIDFMRPLAEMEFTEVRNEFRRQCGAQYGVMPLFQADLSTSGGLNNEGLQVTVTNRAVKDGQGVYNDGFYKWITKTFMITDYDILLNPNEEQDLMAKENLKGKRIQNAAMMQNMGYETTLTEEGDFEFEPIEEPVERPDPFGGGGLPFGNPQANPQNPQQGKQRFEGEPESQRKSLDVTKREHNPKFEAESEKIRQNKETVKFPHKFKNAEWTHPNGHPRCLSCGDEETLNGICTKDMSKQDAPVTTQTVGVHNPVHTRRNRMLKECLRQNMSDITGNLDEINMLEKADPNDLREFIEGSLYTHKFDGLSKSLSDRIKDFLLRAQVKKLGNEKIISSVNRMAKDLPTGRVQNIVRTEGHEIKNRVREWAYRKTDPELKDRYKWIGPSDDRETQICKEIKKRTSQGVTIDQLQKIIDEESQNGIKRGELPADFNAREYTPHFSCRHTFIRSFN